MIRIFQGSALSLLLALGLAGGPAHAQSAVCDDDGNGYVSADEAEQCADRNYSTLLGGEESMSEESFSGVHGAEAFSTVDADQDGMVTREEYVQWRRDEFDTALGASDEMPASDYETWSAEADVRKSQGADSQTSGGGTDSGAGSGGTGGGGTGSGGGGTSN